MEVVVVILLATVILAVVIDMAMRRTERRPRDPLLSTTQKIIVDLKRRR